MMKKILFIINTLGCGGAERAMLNLLQELHGNNCEISLFVLTGQGELIRDLPENVKLLNKNYKPVSVLGKNGRRLLGKNVLKVGICKGLFIKRAAYLLKNYRIMRKNGKVLPDKLFWRIIAEGTPKIEEEYDLAVAYLEGGSTYYTADRVNAKKKVAFVHIDYQRAGYTRELDLDCYKKFDKIFAVSDEVKENFLRVYPEYENKLAVFNNILHLEKIKHLSQNGEGFDDGFHGKRILTVGRLTKQKRFDIAIETMKLLKQKSNIPLRWYVLGDGDLKQSLEKTIKSEGLEKDFLMLGVKENPYPYFYNCDLYVHATEFEGKSIALQEAQVLGKPIIATDCSGNREQIENGVDGILCELAPQAICENILSLINNPELCKIFGERSKQKVIYTTNGLEIFLDMLK